MTLMRAIDSAWFYTVIASQNQHKQDVSIALPARW